MNTVNTAEVLHNGKARNVLLAFVGLCLLLLSINAIHYALQPKYQGMTIDEWFADFHIVPFCGTGTPKVNRWPDTPFNQFGTNAAMYLWSERNRSEGNLANWFWNVKAHRLNSAEQIDDAHRRYNAGICLLGIGELAQPLIPELIQRVDGQDIDEAKFAAQLLGTIHQSPELCVPALIRAIEQTNRIPQHDHAIYTSALASFGRQAESALPALLQLHAMAKRDKTADEFQIALTLLEIDQGKFLDQYWTSILNPSNEVASLRRLSAYADIGYVPPESAHKLEQYSQTITNESHAKLLQKAARVIRKPELIFDISL